MPKISRESLFVLVWAIILGTSGLKWIPILSIGPIKVEIHNAVVLYLDAVFVYYFCTRKRIRLPNFVWTLALLTIWITAGLAIHGTINLSPIILTLPVVLASVVICNMRIDSLENLPAIALASQSIIILAFVVSAIVSETDLLGGVLEYVTSLDRNRFVLGPLRTSFNAFSSGTITNGLPEYDGWLLNHLSASLYITFVLAVAAQPRTKWQAYALNISALFSVSVILILFSSTVIIALFYALAIMFVRFIFGSNKPWVFLIFISITLVFAVFLMPSVLEYIAFNVVSDEGSASSRMDQYAGAIEGIMENPVFGVGLRTYDNHTVHNLFLASFSMTGVVGGLLAISAFFAAGAMMYEGLARLAKGTAHPSLCLIMAMTPIIFITRAGFAGGFGLPSNAELFSFSIAYLCRLRLKKIEAGQDVLSNGGGESVVLSRNAAV